MKKKELPVMVGCVITGEDKERLDKKCAPHEVPDVIKAFLMGILNADIKISKVVNRNER